MPRSSSLLLLYYSVVEQPDFRKVDAELNLDAFLDVHSGAYLLSRQSCDRGRCHVQMTQHSEPRMCLKVTVAMKTPFKSNICAVALHNRYRFLSDATSLNYCCTTCRSGLLPSWGLFPTWRPSTWCLQTKNVTHTMRQVDRRRAGLRGLRNNVLGTTPYARLASI